MNIKFLFCVVEREVMIRVAIVISRNNMHKRLYSLSGEIIDTVFQQRIKNYSTICNGSPQNPYFEQNILY